MRNRIKKTSKIINRSKFPYSLKKRKKDLIILPTMEWWMKHDPEQIDHDFGRGCIICNRAVPSGWKSSHICKKIGE